MSQRPALSANFTPPPSKPSANSSPPVASYKPPPSVPPIQPLQPARTNPQMDNTNISPNTYLVTPPKYQVGQGTAAPRVQITMPNSTKEISEVRTAERASENMYGSESSLMRDRALDSSRFTSRADSVPLPERRPVNVPELLTQRVPFNPQRPFGSNAQVLVFAEDHTANSIRAFIQSQLPQLQQQGVRMLAMEQLPSNLQPLLDRWDDTARQTVRQYLDNWWNKGPGVVDSYMSLIETAKSLGMRVIAMEHPGALQMNRGAVDPYWANIIQSNLAGGRIAVLGGSGHMGFGPASFPGILQNNGISVLKIGFTGFHDQAGLDNALAVQKLTGGVLAPTIEERFTLATRGTEIGREKFMVFVDEGREKYWLVNLPREDK